MRNRPRERDEKLMLWKNSNEINREKGKYEKWLKIATDLKLLLDFVHLSHVLSCKCIITELIDYEYEWKKKVLY